MALPRVLLSLASALLFGSSAFAAAPTRREPPPVQEILTLSAADGLQIPAILTSPAAGVSSGGPIVIHIPDGPGGSPARRTEAARYLAVALAKLGYPNLSLETRHVMQFPFTRFEEAFADVKAAVDLATSRGFPSVILEGSGFGSLLAVRYASETGDARVKAVIALAPSSDLGATWRAKVGEDAYARTVEQATRAGNDTGAANMIDLGDGLVFTPAVFLDWYGPTAKTSMAGAVGNYDKPLFLGAGGDDPAASTARLQRLLQNASSKKSVSKMYPGVGHDLSRVADIVAVDCAKWLVDLGLGPLPKVTTTLVDVTTSDGIGLTGVLYAPAIALPSSSRRPAFLLVHGFGGDIMRSTTHALGQRLAQHGFTALAIRTRGSGLRNTISARLDEFPKDFAAWSAFLGTRGASRVIGVGQGIGGLWLSVYLSESQDPRFRGAVYLGPTRDLPAHAKRGMGEDAYTKAIREAEVAVKAGKGASTLINVALPTTVYDEDPRQPMFLGQPGTGYIYSYADAFLSYWGPNSLGVHRERVAEMKIPILAIGGSRDPMMAGGWLVQFIKAAGGPSASIFYGGPIGAPASFDGFDSRVAEDVIGWAERLP